MSAKTDTNPARAAKDGAAPDSPANPVIPPPSAGLKGWLPVIVSLVLAPVATWATVEFVLVPRLQKKIAAPAAASADSPTPTPAAPAKGGKDGAKDVSNNYEFTNVVVNLAGTMGTRYLKTSFVITGADPKMKAIFEASKPKLTDVTLNVLSSLTLADLEEPGAKNVLREKLVTAYNQTLGAKVADQVYFSDFVVQ